MGKPKSSIQEIGLTPSTLPPSHLIVRLGPPKGSGNFISFDENEIERLVAISGKVRRSKVILTRGDYAFVQLYPSAPTDEEKQSRLAGEIVGMISSKEVKTWRKEGQWPENFDRASAPEKAAESSQSLNEDGTQTELLSEDHDNTIIDCESSPTIANTDEKAEK